MTETSQSEPDREAIESLLEWSLRPKPRPDVPIYKGMECCPYCGIEVDGAMIERAARALVPYVAGALAEDRWTREAVVSVLKAALDERNRP